MSEQLQVLTIGHSNHPIDRFLSLLRRHSVTAVIDVRSVPYSRTNPQFNRENLLTVFKGYDIEYMFLGNELGARTDDRSCYQNGRVQYNRLAKRREFQLGLNSVCVKAHTHRIVLMCAERDPLECHRTILVGRHLFITGVSVVHIHANGNLESHHDAMKRLLKLVGLPEIDLFRSEDELIEEACLKQEERVAYVDKNHRYRSLR